MEDRIITVYGASSARIPERVKDVAAETGSLLARSGVSVMSGGGSTGVMGAVTDGALSAGGRAIGVLPSFMIERGWAHASLSERIVTETMAERKGVLLRCASSVIAFPGGFGTLEELTEAMTQRQLGLWHGRIILMNIDGYYDNFLAQIRHAVELGFMQADHLELFEVATDAAEAVGLALRPDNHGPFTQKIRDRRQ